MKIIVGSSHYYRVSYIYVDNFLIGLDSNDEIVGVHEETKHIFKRANINVLEWNSNYEESFWSPSQLVKDLHLLKCWELFETDLIIQLLSQGSML